MNSSAEVVEIRAHRDRKIPPGALRKLFDHVGWDRPAEDEGVAAVLEAGPAVGAWRGEDLVGFARALSDGCFAAYVEDVMVHREWRGRGIGERVLSLLLVEDGDVVNVSLFCEPPVVGFYEAGGFRRTSYVLMRRAKQRLEEGSGVTRTFALLGVPSSAGAHWPGQEKAPRALREAGLVERLRAAGLQVEDYGDLPRTRFRPDAGRHPQSLDAVVGVARTLAGRVEEILRNGHAPLVVGGDCTIEM